MTYGVHILIRICSIGLDKKCHIIIIQLLSKYLIFNNIIITTQ